MLVYRAVELKKGSHVRLVAQVLVSLRFTVLQAVGSVHCLAGAGIPGRQVLAGVPSTNRMESHGTVTRITPDYGTFRPPADRTLPIPPAPDSLTIRHPWSQDLLGQELIPGNCDPCISVHSSTQRSAIRFWEAK